MNERLKHISGKEQLVLGPTDGQEALAGATEAFRYIDSNFGHWNCDVSGPPTAETLVQVYEMVSDSTFQECLVVLASGSTVLPSPKRKSSNSCSVIPTG